MPKISVIIPIYNVEKYLICCLESLTFQTFTDWEAICINDGSLDNSAKILEKYAKQDRRFKIITQENQGLSMARNNGLKHACGTYIYFLDSDDRLHPQCLEIAYDTAEKNNAALVCFEFEKTNSDQPPAKKIDIHHICGKVVANPLFYLGKKKPYRVSYNVWSKLYKKELIDGISFIPGIYFEDYPYVASVLAEKPLTVLLAEKLYFYTINESSISHQQHNPKQIKDYHCGIRYICNIYRNKGMETELSFLKQTLIPTLLKQQLKKISDAPEETKAEMLLYFREELIELELNSLFSLKGQLRRYWHYHKIIEKGTL